MIDSRFKIVLVTYIYIYVQNTTYQLLTFTFIHLADALSIATNY